MNILVDCVPFDGGKSGISVYMRSVVNALAAQGHHLVLIVEPEAVNAFSGFEQIVLPAFTRRPVLSMLYHLFLLPFRLMSRKQDFDLCILCAGNRRVMSFYPIRTVAVVHDLAPCQVKGKYDPFRTFYQHSVVPFFVKRVRFLFAISKCTASDMTKFWHVPQNRIRINYNGVVLHKPGTQNFLEKFKLTAGKYIFYVSRLEFPGKNQHGLIQAYSMLGDDLQKEYKLVLAGAFWNEEQKFRDYAAKAKYPENIVFTGFLTNAELESAYRHAAMYVFPSFYEGFGLSLLEAMHNGLPCACSENSSLGEIGRDAALLFDPTAPSAIAKALKSVLTDPELREELQAKGRHRAGEFTWSRHARMLANTALPKPRAK